MASKSRAETKATERAERLEVLKKQQKAQERRRNLMVGGVVAAVLVVIVAVFILVGQKNNVDTTGTGEAGNSKYGLAIGSADAPDKIVIYEDFLCPFCGQLESATHEKLASLADDGKVYVDYRPFDLLGDYSARTAGAFGVVLDKSGPEVAKKFHDLLYANQPTEGDEPYPDADAILALAVQAGATEADVADGIKAGANDFSTGATKEAQDAGVQGTPTITLNGTAFNGTPQELLDAVS